MVYLTNLLQLFPQAICAIQAVNSETDLAPPRGMTWYPSLPFVKLWRPSCLDHGPTSAKPYLPMWQSPLCIYRTTCSIFVSVELQNSVLCPFWGINSVFCGFFWELIYAHTSSPHQAGSMWGYSGWSGSYSLNTYMFGKMVTWSCLWV